MKKPVNNLRNDAVVIRTVQYLPKEKRDSIEAYINRVLGSEPIYMYVTAHQKIDVEPYG